MNIMKLYKEAFGLYVKNWSYFVSVGVVFLGVIYMLSQFKAVPALVTVLVSFTLYRFLLGRLSIEITEHKALTYKNLFGQLTGKYFLNYSLLSVITLGLLLVPLAFSRLAIEVAFSLFDTSVVTQTGLWMAWAIMSLGVVFTIAFWPALTYALHWALAKQQNATVIFRKSFTIARKNWLKICIILLINTVLFVLSVATFFVGFLLFVPIGTLAFALFYEKTKPNKG